MTDYDVKEHELEEGEMVIAPSLPVVTEDERKAATFILHGVVFCPYDHFVKIRDKSGQLKEYLPYAARLAWFRAARPKGEIKTEIVEHDRQEGFVLIKAYVDDGDGVHAEAYGSCTKAGFDRGYIEKAETKAKNRAIADLGYGTLAAQELIEDDQDGEVSDTPLAPRRPPANGRSVKTEAPRPVKPQSVPSAPAQPLRAVPVQAAPVVESSAQQQEEIPIEREIWTRARALVRADGTQATIEYVASRALGIAEPVAKKRIEDGLKYHELEKVFRFVVKLEQIAAAKAAPASIPQAS